MKLLVHNKIVVSLTLHLIDYLFLLTMMWQELIFCKSNVSGYDSMRVDGFLNQKALVSTAGAFLMSKFPTLPRETIRYRLLQHLWHLVLEKEIVGVSRCLSALQMQHFAFHIAVYFLRVMLAIQA